MYELREHTQTLPADRRLTPSTTLSLPTPRPDDDYILDDKAWVDLSNKDLEWREPQD